MRTSQKKPSGFEQRIDLEEAKQAIFKAMANACLNKNWAELLQVHVLVEALVDYENARSSLVWRLNLPAKLPKVESSVAQAAKAIPKKPKSKGWRTTPGTPPAKVRWERVAKKNAKGSTKKLVEKVESSVAQAVKAIHKKAMSQARKNANKKIIK